MELKTNFEKISRKNCIILTCYLQGGFLRNLHIKLVHRFIYKKMRGTSHFFLIYDVQMYKQLHHLLEEKRLHSIRSSFFLMRNLFM